MWTLLLVMQAAAADGCEVDVRKRVKPVFPPSDLTGEVVCRVHAELDATPTVTSVTPTDCPSGFVPAVGAAMRRWDIRMTDGCGPAARGSLDLWFTTHPTPATEADVFTEASLAQVESAWSSLPADGDACTVQATIHSTADVSELARSGVDCVGLPDWTPVWPGPAADGVTCAVFFQVKKNRARRFDAASCPPNVQEAALATAEAWSWYNPYKDWMPFVLRLHWTRAPLTETPPLR